MNSENKGLSILEAACIEFKCTMQELLSNTRERRVADARKTIIWYYRTRTKITLKESGAMVSRTHATALSAFQQCKSLMKIDSVFRTHVNNVLAMVKNTPVERPSAYNRLDMIQFGMMLTGKEEPEMIRCLGQYENRNEKTNIGKFADKL